MLALHLTGSRGAGVIAGIVFAFVPYRFAHYMHMELQWTVWVPWTFWALHRTFETGSRRYGAMVGAFLGLQFLSSIYYGLFLATLLALCAGILLCASDRRLLGSRISALATGVFAAAVLVTPYAIPYAGQKYQVGARSEEQVLMFSARPSNYIVSTPSNYLYGERSAPRARMERMLFPGVLPLLLAVTGLFLVHPSRVAIMYLLGLVAAFEMSLGFYGYSFTFLYHHVPVFNSLRAPARLGIFVVFFLAILAAKGYAVLASSVRPRVTPCPPPGDLRHTPPGVLGGAASPRFLPKPGAPSVRLAGQTAAGGCRRISDAHPLHTAGARTALRVHVDVPLDAYAEWLQRVLPAVLYRAARSDEHAS